MNKKRLDIIGPFATEYSLAKVNRELAFAIAQLESEYEVELWADEIFADRLPTQSDYKKYPKLKEFYKPNSERARIAIYNSFPKGSNLPHGLEKIDAEIKLAYVAWEESVYPKHFVKECNKQLHGILVTSEHVRRVLRDSGIKLPMKVVNLGVKWNDHPNKKYQVKTKKQFKFLHISSAHYRKGVDILLKAYFEQFTQEDDVCLVLKLFPNPHVRVRELIAELKQENSPEVELIEDPDLTDDEIYSLYYQCDSVVLPSRAEGFGIPMAEAMHAKLPLITTGYSGHMDFCSEDNCFLVDFDIVRSESPLSIPGARVAEPDLSDLKSKMKFIFDHHKEKAVQKKVENAYTEIHELTWCRAAKSVISFIKKIENTDQLKKENVAVMTPINTPGGIAEYSKNFYSNIEESFKNITYLANSDSSQKNQKDDGNTLRCWEMGGDDFSDLIEAIRKTKPSLVHIQYNLPFFTLRSLLDIAKVITQMGIKVYVTLHSVQFSHVDFKKYVNELAIYDKIFVHSLNDMNFLERMGYKNIIHFYHGMPLFSDTNKAKLRKRLNIKNSPIISSHGLIHNKKGLIETLNAIAILKKDYPNILYIGVNALNIDNSTSAGTYEEMKETIIKKGLDDNVIIVTEFLELVEVIKLLQISDMIVLPYPELKEGASGAVRTAMAAKRPVIITHSHIFSDLEVGYRIEDNRPETIAKGINRLIIDKNLYKKELDSIVSYNKKYSWDQMSIEYLSQIT